jgi:hypothetical protein
MAVFHPSGEACIEVGTSGRPDQTFTRDQVRQLIDKLEAFERLCTFEDGRPDTRQRIYREAL